MTETEAWKADRIGSARAGTNPTKRQRREFLEDMDTLGEAVETACRAADPGFRRMNYEILGNTDAYLHAHLFPRYSWEAPEHVGKPVWLYDPVQFYGAEVALAARHDTLRARTVAELAALGVGQGSTSPDRMA